MFIRILRFDHCFGEPMWLGRSSARSSIGARHRLIARVLPALTLLSPCSGPLEHSSRNPSDSKVEQAGSHLYLRMYLRLILWVLFLAVPYRHARP